jgi:hypothetical protein
LDTFSAEITPHAEAETRVLLPNDALEHERPEL